MTILKQKKKRLVLKVYQLSSNYSFITVFFITTTVTYSKLKKNETHECVCKNVTLINLSLVLSCTYLWTFADECSVR